MEQEEVEVLACPEILLSAACLAAVVIGTQAPETDSLLLGAITFPAVCQDSTVLRRGPAVNSGQHQAPQPGLSVVEIADVSVIHVELRKEYLLDWGTACKNHLKYSYNVVDACRKEVPKEQATS